MAKTILVVEDVDFLQKGVREALVGAGYSVLAAANGEEGYALALKKHPDLILLDILMPVMDGISMLKLLRKDKWGKKVPVVVMTNVTDKKILMDAAKENAEYFIKSDWDIDELVDIVNEKLEG